MASQRTLKMGRRDFLRAAGTVAAAPLLAAVPLQASAQEASSRSSVAIPSSARRKLGPLEVSSVGLGVQNMSRTYQTTIPTGPR